MNHIKFYRLLVVLTTVLLLVGSVNDSFAQKKSRRKDKKDVKEVNTVPTIVGPEEQRKAEYYHTEAEKYFILEDFAKAFVLYQKALEFDPNDATAYYKIAQIYLKSEDYDKAVINAQKAVDLDKTNKYFYLLLAEIYTKQSNFAQASTVYENMLANCQNADDYLFDLAALYIYQDNYAKALAIYDQIEQKYGLNEQVIYQKQKLYLKQGNLEKAIEEGKKLITAFPDEPRYVLNLADILISNEQYDKAIPYLDSLLKSNPNDPHALLMLSDVYRKNGNSEKANIFLSKAFANPDLDLQQKLQVMVGFMQKFPNEDLEKLTVSLGEKIMAAHPSEPDAYAINGDLMLKLKEPQKALDYYYKAMDLGKKDYDIWQNVIQLELQEQKYDQAIKHGEKAQELYPNQAGLCWLLGSAYLAKKNYDDAIQVLETGKKLSSSNDQLRSYFNAQLGDAYNFVKNYKKSDESYEAALAFDPNNDYVLNNYSYFLALRKEKLDLAKKMSAKLTERNPDNSTYLDTYAWVLFQLGDYSDAKTNIEKALQGKDVSGTIIEHYGDILFKLGEVDSAVKQWQKAKGMDEKSDLIDKKIADRKLYE